MRPRSMWPTTSSPSLSLRGMRNHITSIGAPRSSDLRPARSRIVEWRPSQPTTRSARISMSPSSVLARSPTIRPPSSIRSVASARMRRSKPGYFLPCPARKLRKSHCGMKAMNLHTVGRPVSAIFTVSAPICMLIWSTFECGSLRNSSSSPSSCIISSVEGCTVSPRKSRRKSLCFSRMTTGTPARASRKPSIMPAGPPPAMQQVVLIAAMAPGSIIDNVVFDCGFQI